MPERTALCAPAHSQNQRFGKLDIETMARKDVTAGAKVALTAMRMESFGTGGVALSYSILAIRTGFSRSYARDCLKELLAKHLIAKDGPPAGKVQRYRIICEEPQKSVAIAPAEQSAAKATVKLFPCSECKRPCRNSKTGWCWKCMQKREIKTIVREEINRGRITA